MLAHKVAQTKKTIVKIGGMHCAGCVNSIQRYVSELGGVSKVEVNLANERAVFEYDPAQVRIADIEKAAVFLCSDAASFINGAMLVIDGGHWLAANRTVGM